MRSLLRPSLTLFVALTLITGMAYPLAITSLAGLFFPHQAGGSLVSRDDVPVGSILIGQAFSQPRYFWSRPSATSPMSNNASASGGSNQGPLSPALVDAVRTRIQSLRDSNPGSAGLVPADLVTASASGLDPHISVAAAQYQAERVARVRQLPLERVQGLIAEHSEGALFGLLGEPRVNVLVLNLSLDASH